MGSQSWTFFQAFLKSPRVVASMIPSSPFLERRLVEAGRLATAATVVELGSGTGGTTRAMLEALGSRADAKPLTDARASARFRVRCCHASQSRLRDLSGAYASVDTLRRLRPGPTAPRTGRSWPGRRGTA